MGKRGPLSPEVPAAVEVHLTVAVKIVAVHTDGEPVERLGELVAGVAEGIGQMVVAGATALFGTLTVFTPVRFHIANSP